VFEGLEGKDDDVRSREKRNPLMDSGYSKTSENNLSGGSY